MDMTFRLGRIAGIDIGFNWTVLVIAWLICFSVSTQTLPETTPGYSSGAYWGAGVVVSVLFFVSLLVHELAHSLLAQRAGVRVRDITLWMLGGVSRFENEADDAGIELRVAVVGPLSSLALAVGFGVLTSAFSLAGLPELVIAVPALLSGLNLILGLFNLLPAYPMDGGRVLRAALWKRHGDRLRATQTAAAAGRIAGWGFIVLGLVTVAGGAGFSGVWLVFIGGFLLFASTVERAGVESRELLAGVQVAGVMTPDPVTVPPDLTVADLIDRYVLASRVSAYPVVVDGRPSGLVTLSEVRGVAADARASTTVDRIARPVTEVPTPAPTDRLLDVLPELVASPSGRALVLEDGRLVGIVSHTDVTRAMEIRDLARASG